MSTKDSSLVVELGMVGAVIVVLVVEITLMVTVEDNMITMTHDHRHMI
jgi:hypothetical protein